MKRSCGRHIFGVWSSAFRRRIYFLIMGRLKAELQTMALLLLNHVGNSDRLVFLLSLNLDRHLAGLFVHADDCPVSSGSIDSDLNPVSRFVLRFDRWARISRRRWHSRSRR